LSGPGFKDPKRNAISKIASRRLAPVIVAPPALSLLL
jgi:hypothetical protein